MSNTEAISEVNKLPSGVIVDGHNIVDKGLSDGLLGSIGNTPLIEVKSLSKLTGCKILVKAEHMNPGGSVKDRAAKWLIADAEKRGVAQPFTGQTIVEATGGNTGIGLALVTAARGYKPIFTMPENISPDKIELMKTLGAQVLLQPQVPFADPRHYYHVAAKVAQETGGVWTNQFENLANAKCHYESTGPEVWKQTGGKVDAFVASCGTGGTLSGMSNFLKDQDPNIQCFLIDPYGSGLYDYFKTGCFKSEGNSITEGIGIMRLTANFGAARVDDSFKGTDKELVEMAYFLLKHDGLFIGPSAALNCVGAVKAARKLGKPGATIVTVICDGGERYRNKLFNKEVLAEKNILPEHQEFNLDFVL